MSPQVALVADDDEFFRIALAAILKNQLGFGQVVETGSLDEAIERLADHDDCCLALFDLTMPGMESAASLGAVREVHPDTKVAVVSASTRRADILAALAAGIHGYVPKSLGAHDLAAALRMILNGAIYVPPSLAGRPAEPEPSPPAAASREMSPRRAIEFLTPRQREVLLLLVEGLSNKEIARRLRLGEGTVKIHMAALFRSLRVRNRQEAAAAGARLLPMAER